MAHHLEVLHQALIGEMIDRQLEAIEITARLDRVPGKQVRLCHGHQGVSPLQGCRLDNDNDPLVATLFHPLRGAWGDFSPSRPSVTRKSLIVPSPLG
ncbi:hypothetical protein [Halochromatium roseum]|uniref:hypothetical protein n=1 Tax=Halochromatium roseum TaxID=391920 RepID=UPI001A93296F|nr:hypothetical protein [Halochromatium roseum]